MAMIAHKSVRSLIIVGGLVALYLPLSLSAQVITEIMYDAPGADTGHEWIEIQNTSSSAIPLTTWKLFEASTNHKITAVSGGEALAPGAYAVIADSSEKFLADRPSFSLQLFDSTFSLSNSGETLILRDDTLRDITSATYLGTSGAAGDGNSLQRESVNGKFTVRSPSPGTSLGGPAIVKIASVSAPSKKSVAKTATPVSLVETSDQDAEPVSQESSVTPTSTQVASVGEAGSTLPWWLLGTLGFAGAAGGLAVFINRSRRESWTITDKSV